MVFRDGIYHIALATVRQSLYELQLKKRERLCGGKPSRNIPAKIVTHKFL